MAVPVYTTDLTDISLAENVTNWDESGNAGWRAGGGPTQETDYYIQGSFCVSEILKTGVGSLIYNFGTTVTFGTDDVFLVWHYNQCPNALGTYAQGGIRQIAGNSFNDFYAWSVLGSDTYEYGGWKCVPVNPNTTTANYTAGTPTGNFSYFGNAMNHTGNVAKGNPHGIDAVRYGRARSIFLEGDAGNGYCTFAGFALQNDSGTNRWGLIQEIEGGYLYQGLMQLGSGTTIVDFRDSNVALSINDTIRTTSNFNRIEIWNPASYVSWDNIYFTALGTNSRGYFEMMENAIVNLESCSFTNMASFNFLSGATINNTTFRNTYKITQSGATFDNCLFADISGSTHLLVDDLSNISSCNFESLGFGHAIELTHSASGQSYILTDFTYLGYAAPSVPPFTGTTGNEVIYNNSAGHVQLTIDGGDTPSIRNGVGATTEFVFSVTLSFSVVDENNNPVSGATAYIDNDNTSPYIMNTLTNSAGTASAVWTGGAVGTSYWRVRKYGYKPYSLTTNIPESGTKNIPVTLVSDANQTLPLSTSFDETKWTIDYTGKTITNIDSGVGNNLPVNTGGTWFVEDIRDWFRWLAWELSTGTTMKYTYPINAVTPRQFELVNSWNFGDNDNDNKYLYGGSLATSGGTKLWSNLYSLGAQVDGTQMYLIQADEEVSPWWITGDIDLLIKVKDNGTFIQSTDSDGTLIDGGLWVYAREFGDTFDHNFIDLSAAGRNPISINTSQDINNTSGEIYVTVDTATGLTANNFVKGVTSGTVAKIEKISTNNVYLNSIRPKVGFTSGENLNEYSDREAQNFTGSAIMVGAQSPVMETFTGITITFGSVTKDLNNGAGLRPYEVVIDCKGYTLANVYQYLKYVVRYASSGSTFTIQGDAGQEYRNASGVTWLDVKSAPFGTFAGGKFFGARGVWIENMDGGDIQNYQLVDSDDVNQSSPEQYSLILTGVVEGSEIRIFTGSTNEIAGVEYLTGTTFTYSYIYTGDFDVDIVVHNLGYVFIRINGVSLSNSTSSIPIQQQVDRWYLNP